MRFNSTISLLVFSALSELVAAASTCSDAQKIAGVKQEVAAIRSHSIADANKIPYAPTVYRVFTITPNETKPTSVFIPAGIDAITTRVVLLGLGMFLQAGVPQGSDHYSVNPNGTVTVDYVQTDGVALQEVDMREIHSFNDASCQITGINGYVRGNLEAFTGNLNIPALIQKLAAGESVGPSHARLKSSL